MLESNVRELSAIMPLNYIESAVTNSDLQNKNFHANQFSTFVAASRSGQLRPSPKIF
jgi:hypothetical protein